ncbi:Transcription factor TGA like domain [Macleaya cordata]|uniref:Transcription factor TGA like domain n=1 Tax=Macleaya cordata TaxID=56857 RepID=A0A200QBX9_MACCD|nr:Transcription factor TGA like domain [Macleaya cordata]
MLSPSWRSSLEEAFLWIGGWRPSMAFHLLYSKSGLQLEARLDDIIHGLSTGDLADLSASQLVSVDELQRRTIKEEKEITEKMAEHQETVADSSMVELSNVVSELMRNGADLTQNGEVVERVESTLAPKEDGLERIMERADDLRLRTLKGVIDILTPIQAVDFLIAAAELHLRLHDWGKQRDANHHVDENRRGAHHQHFSGSPSAAATAGVGHHG